VIPLAAAMAAVVVVTTWMAHWRPIPDLEVDAFRLVNDLPGGLELPLWLPMQFGAVAAVPITFLVALYFWRRRLERPAAVLAAGVAAWLLSKAIKEIPTRGRPATYLDDVELRGGSIGGGHNEGLGFPSGHAAVAFALATVLWPYLPPRWRWVPVAAAVIVGFGRMYFGAHLPLDIVGGSAFGVLLGVAALWGARRYSGTTRAMAATER
jgi:membrane-associated phospholipid phosphatase